jgi:hypothetical protein
MRYISRQSKAVRQRCKNNKPFFNGTPVQAKPEDDAIGDKYEQEANVMARKVVNGNVNPGFFKLTSFNKNNGIESDGFRTPLSTGGRGLEPSTRNFMEPKFGYDFSNVKIHNDSTAHQSASNINALAYTHGNNIVFGAGQYQPGTQAGKHLLAHELTHVVQQQGGAPAVQRNPPIDDVSPSDMFDDDVDEFRVNYQLNIVTGVDKSLKEPIKAVKDGAVIKVKIGPGYVSQKDENIRKGWIRAEIVGKFVTNDRFEDLANDPTHAKLRELNPPHSAGDYCHQNCPATAEALGEYLKTGKVNKATCEPLAEGDPGYGFDVSSMNTFTKPLPWKDTEAAIRKQLVKNGDFVVVEGTRSAKQMADRGLSATHYFTVVNVHGKLFAIDASEGGYVRDGLQEFVDGHIVATNYRMAKGDFKVKSTRQ